MPHAEMVKRRAAFDGLGNAELNGLLDAFVVQSDVFYFHAARFDRMPPSRPQEEVRNTLSGRWYTGMILNIHGDVRITRLEAVEHPEYELYAPRIGRFAL